MTEEKHIEEILYKSHSKGIYREVMDRASDIMGSEDFNDRRIDAYTQAYTEIVNKKQQYYIFIDMSFRKRIALQRRKKKNLQSNISSDEKPLLARKKRSGGIVNKPKDFRDNRKGRTPRLKERQRNLRTEGGEFTLNVKTYV